MNKNFKQISHFSTSSTTTISDQSLKSNLCYFELRKTILKEEFPLKVLKVLVLKLEKNLESTFKRVKG
jgi:hypothetical protein